MKNLIYFLVILLSVVVAPNAYAQENNVAFPYEKSSRNTRGFWEIMLILLLIALLFSENSLYNFQGITINATFLVGLLLITIAQAISMTVENISKRKRLYLSGVLMN